jgi:1,4-alpha-glucan branching enzyme
VDGYVSFVLHSHMPYVRRNGTFPVGEDWLYQVMSETYIPLLGMLAQLQGESLGMCLALTMTPVLCEQLADPYINERFVSYLKVMREHAADDVRDFEYFSDNERKALAQGYGEEFRRKLMAYTAIGGDLLGAIASFEDEGMIETIASCATHAFLPGLGDMRSVREQVLLGIESHERHLGVRPRGFWLPECAYRQGIEELLEGEGIEYFIVDSTALAGKPAGRPYTVGDSRVVALARSDSAHADVWDESTGYPTDATYLDSTKYYHGSGLHYWKVSGQDVDIEHKAVYSPDPAKARALDHAGHFIRDLASEIEMLNGTSRDRGTPETRWVDPPIVMACYDTEFFGHGWKEGFYWLELTLRSLAAFESMRLTLPSRFLRENAEREEVSLLPTTWGTGRDDSTWFNDSTVTMWAQLRGAEARLDELLASEAAGKGPVARRMLKQAAREVLLLESSDWPYMVAKDRARDYANERFEAHLRRFAELADGLEGEGGKSAETALDEIEEADNIFAGLDLNVVSGHGGPRGAEGS